MDKIKVLLADDHPVVREGLNAMLGTASDIEVVAEAGDGFEAVDKANKHQPDVVLMDLSMPNLDGLEATRRIKKQLPSTAVIILTVYDNDAYVMDAVKAGAGGYLLKDTSKDLLINTIRAVNSGGMLVKTSLLRKAFRGLTEAADVQLAEKPTSIMIPNELTSREHDVLQLLTQGRSNKEIGRALCISEDTAKKHVQTIMLKLRVSDRTQAAVKAVRNGLVTNFPDKEI